MWLLILLCGVILIVTTEKMSLMPLRASMAWAFLWGICGCIGTILFAGMSRQEAFTLLNVGNISTLEFMELMIMLCYIFSRGVIKKILGFYPGLMMIAPVCVITYLSIGLFPGMNFILAGTINGGMVILALTCMILLFRSLAVDDNVFYKTVLAALLVNIIIFGLL